MKKKSIIIIMSAVIVVSAAFSACSLITTPGGPDSTDSSLSSSSDEERIKELEAKIVALMQNQQQSESESLKEITALKEELAALKKDKETQNNSDLGTDKSTDTGSIERFRYTLDGGVATITAILTHEENIVIPSTIDGYRVRAIGSEALSSSVIKSITISSGVEKLDWFAFKNCPSLSSVSIPDSVSSIGYGAFDNSSPSLIIRCSRDSFAHRYAQSYGFTYDIT